MKHLYIFTLMSLTLVLNQLHAQTVAINDNTLGAMATYTFTYETTYAIGTGSITPNIMYLTKPDAYPDFATVNPLSAFAPHLTVKVDGIVIPIDTENFGTIHGSWETGIQISVSGASAGTTIPAGSTIEVIVEDIIKNPSEEGVYTFEWKTAKSNANQLTQQYFGDIDFSALPTSVSNIKENELSIRAFPNPSSEFIKISGLGKTQSYKIYNLTGAEMKKGIISDKEFLSISDLPAGMYFLNIEEGATIKFIKE